MIHSIISMNKKELKNLASLLGKASAKARKDKLGKKGYSELMKKVSNARFDKKVETIVQ